MKDKEKQINELGNILYCRQDKYDLSNPFEVAKCVVDLGYRNCKDSVVLTQQEYLNIVTRVRKEFEYEYKDKVVLSKEEYQKGNLKLFAKAYNKGSKETAKKIIKHLLNFIENETFHVGYELDKVERELYKLAKQFGVEVDK